jgi:hypothetical protein
LQLLDLRRKGPSQEQVVDFIIFFITMSVVATVAVYTHLLLLAPPLGVTVYLATLARRSDASRPEVVAGSYAFVMASTLVLQTVLGFSTVTAVTNVLLVSAFIFFTRFKHPPAVALTLFSFIAHTTVTLVLTVAVFLAIVIGIQFAVERINKSIEAKAQIRQIAAGIRKKAA